MFQAFKNPSGQAATGGDQNEITSPRRILRFLDRIREGRLLLTVTIPGHKSQFSTTLLKINPEKHVLYLDELNPKKGHQLFLKVGKLRVKAMLEGVDLVFFTKLEKAGHHDGIAFYRTSIPASVRYHQRRAHHRFRIGRHLALPITVCSERLDDSIQGQLRDISLGGMGATIEHSSSIQTGEYLSSCNLQLPDNERVTFALDVRSIQPENRGKLLIGAQFQELDTSNRNRLSYFIRALEREYLKHRRKY